jgi:phosphoglycolate phosphatase
MSKLVLFDIDKTLIKSSSAWRFSEAFKKVYGVDTNISIINHHGMTDQQIIIEVLKKNGIDEKIIVSKLKEYMTEMVDSYKKSGEKDEIILLGDVKESIDALIKKGDIVLGLVTGILESIAWAKLKKAGIDGYFSVGGFGSDDINRANLVRLAVKKAEDKFGIKFDTVFLVGDAPQDMKAGKEAGVKTAGVTTGIYTKKDLEKAGADYIMAGLKGLLGII